MAINIIASFRICLLAIKPLPLLPIYRKRHKLPFSENAYMVSIGALMIK